MNLGQFPVLKHEWKTCKTLRLPHESTVGRVKLSSHMNKIGKNSFGSAIKQELPYHFLLQHKKKKEKEKKKQRDNEIEMYNTFQFNSKKKKCNCTCSCTTEKGIKFDICLQRNPSGTSDYSLGSLIGKEQNPTPCCCLL